MEIDQASLTTSPWIHAEIIQSNTLSPGDHAYLHEIGTRRHFPKGTVIQNAGDVGDHLYYLECGTVRNSLISADGSEKVIYYLNAGCFTGVPPFFHRQPIQYVDTAAESVQALEIESRHVNDLIARPSIAGVLLRTLSFTARILASQIADLSFRSTLEKVCRLLYCQLGSLHDGVAVKSRISQADLANVAAAHRVSISIAISQLRKEGLIDVLHDGTIVVREWEMLRQKGFGY
jgi:CRP/FNR family transcriptional regulator, cyclic AMP receptor protein